MEAFERQMSPIGAESAGATTWTGPCDGSILEQVVLYGTVHSAMHTVLSGY